MKLKELKQETYDAWECLSTFHGAIVQPETFKPDVRAFGDLRHKSTWEKAYVVFTAKATWDSGITPHTFIVYVLADQQNDDLKQQLLEAFLAIPGAMEFVVRGLEEIYQSSNRADREQADEILAMVGEKSRGVGRIAAGSLRRLAGANETRAR